MNKTNSGKIFTSDRRVNQQKNTNGFDKSSFVPRPSGRHAQSKYGDDRMSFARYEDLRATNHDQNDPIYRPLKTSHSYNRSEFSEGFKPRDLEPLVPPTYSTRASKSDFLSTRTVNGSQLINIPPSSARYSVNATEGHDLLYGTNAIVSALNANNRKFWRLLVWNPDPLVLKLASSRNVKVVNVENKGVLNNLSNNRPHNGYVLEASPINVKSIRSLGRISEDKYVVVSHTDEVETFQTPAGRYPLWVWLDRITDPENMGSIIRTCSYLGVEGILISAKNRHLSHTGHTDLNSASLNPVVAKASSGALEWASLFAVNSGTDFIKASSKWKFVAAHMGEPTTDMNDIAQMVKEYPCVLLFGSEDMPSLRGSAK
ncbi:rRNA methyltransferase 1, mitochondrial [Neolecta irregularis DAH-3]|uniref:rRNA methyltransferase 1, mitochondrial n=1 Tax=Neolecta irregularis (strain DAH-3) TaxID=1198029 RepID=A0A1U7LPD7_NEOID|nr:rRNA methyltransferase 1, mitochondrial [Neolecta irregularis DAH-3]|eukprot:OLL24514.1 rRNA methyltransferase 1, mitochondrial [Neolecta irregularis DAH-3]